MEKQINPTKAEKIYSTSEGKVQDVNVNVVKPTFRKKDGTEVPITTLTDEELQDAIHFAESMYERALATAEKMRKLKVYLAYESSWRVRTDVTELIESVDEDSTYDL